MKGMMALAAMLLAGCSAAAFRYDGPDAATLAGDDNLTWSHRTITMVVELNGRSGGPPYTIHPVKVRPGLLRVGLHVQNGAVLSAGCFEVDAAPGSYYQLSASPADGGFLVTLRERRGAERKTIGEAFVPIRRWMNAPAYCPSAS